MVRNYLLAALRSLSKDKLYSGINTIGFAVGLAAFFLIAGWVDNETSYDRHFADDAFPKELAVAAREILWKRIDADPNDVMSWKHPVVRLGMFDDEPFIKAANTPKLHHAFDQLAGKDRGCLVEAWERFPFAFLRKKSQTTPAGMLMQAFPGTIHPIIFPGASMFIRKEDCC